MWYMKSNDQLSSDKSEPLLLDSAIFILQLYKSSHFCYPTIVGSSIVWDRYPTFCSTCSVLKRSWMNVMLQGFLPNQQPQQYSSTLVFFEQNALTFKNMERKKDAQCFDQTGIKPAIYGWSFNWFAHAKVLNMCINALDSGSLCDSNEKITSNHPSLGLT